MSIEFLHSEWTDFVDRASAILPDGITMELNFDSHSIDEDYRPELRDPSETAIFLIYRDGSGIAEQAGGIIASRTVSLEKWERGRCVYLIGLLQEMVDQYLVEVKQ